MPMSETATVAWCFGITGVAIVGICTIIYLIHRTKEKKNAYSHNNSVRCNGVDYFYDPTTKSIVESNAPKSNDSNNNLRKRAQSVSSTATSKNQSETSNNKKNNLTVAKEVQTDPIDMNQNANDTKNLSDKTMPVMNLHEKVNEYLLRNIETNSELPEITNSENPEASFSSDASSWCNLSSEKSTDNSEKAYKKKVHKSLHKYVANLIQANCELRSAENLDDNSDIPSSSSDNSSTSSNWSNISSEKSTDDFDKAYKKKLHKTLKKFVKNMKKTEMSQATSECSDENESLASVSSGDRKVCKCKKSVNTHAVPCNHRYMCSDCAVTVFRMYKKCKICHVRVENFVADE